MDTATPVPEPKKKSKVSILVIFIVILLLAAIGLGTWGFMLNSNLQTTLASRAALQKKYDTLTTDTNAVSGNLEQAGKDLEKAKADLEKAKKDLATAQSDQAKAQESITDHQADIAKALKYLDVAFGMFVLEDTRLEMEQRLELVKDAKLTEKYEKYAKSGSPTDFGAWLSYLFGTIADLLK